MFTTLQLLFTTHHFSERKKCCKNCKMHVCFYDFSQNKQVKYWHGNKLEHFNRNEKNTIFY